MTFSIYLSIDSKTLKKTQPFIADDLSYVDCRVAFHGNTESKNLTV